jgi:group I intron endonuclease
VKNVIYVIRNVVNGKFYVGSTVDARVRFQAHKRRLKKGTHQSPHLQAAWNKYGEDCFKFEVVASVEDRDELLAVEQVWLDEHAGKAHCYNWAADASAPMRGKKHTSEAVAKMLLKHVPKGEEHYRFGRPLDEEIRKKIGDAQRGVPKASGRTMSEQGRANIAAVAKRGEESPFYGKRPTNADDLQKAIHAVLPDRTTKVYSSLTEMRDTLGLAIGTIIRACKSGKPIVFGPHAGWVLSYVDGERNLAPEIPEEYLACPRTRQEAKATGAKHYFTGIPCDRGHISPRKAKGTCVACMKEDYKKDNDRRKQKALDTP